MRVLSFPIASCAALLIAFMCLGTSFALTPNERLDDPQLENRARILSKQLRCVVCQNQSIDDSDADLAKDLRLIVRERLTQGDSDAQVLDYLVSRYGEFVLLKPRLGLHTFILWALPLSILLFGIWAARSLFSTKLQNAQLSEEDEKILEQLSNEK